MDYPTEEEEFELMYSDELELIREQEGLIFLKYYFLVIEMSWDINWIFF